jgi:hypothetical protein
MHIFFAVFLGMYLLYLVFYHVRVNIQGMEYPCARFLFFPQDKYKDFATINHAIKDLNPYISRLSNYPPLILTFAIIFSKMGDYSPYDATTLQDAFNDPAIWRSFVIFIALYCVAVVVCCIVYAYKVLRKNGESRISYKVRAYIAYFILGVMFLVSAPSLYDIDRGNYLVVSIVLYIMWAIAEQESPESNWGPVFAALCAATKIYPVYILGVYFFDKRFKKLIVAVITGAVTTLVPIFFFKGSYLDNVYYFARGVGGFGVGVNAGYFTVGLSGALIYIYRAFDIPVDTKVTHIIWLVAGIVISLVGFKLASKDDKLWRKLLVVTAMMNFLTPNAYLYQTSYLFGPILLMLSDKEKITKKDIPYVIMSAVLLVPKPYAYLHQQTDPTLPNEWNYMNCAIIIDAGLYLLMIILYFAQRFRENRELKIKEVKAS